MVVEVTMSRTVESDSRYINMTAPLRDPGLVWKWVMNWQAVSRWRAGGEGRSTSCAPAMRVWDKIAARGMSGA